MLKHLPHQRGATEPDAGLRTLVVGAGEAGRALARDLRNVPEFGLSPLGFLDDHPGKLGSVDMPVLGRLDDLLTVTIAQRVDVVVLAIPGLSASRVRQLAACAAAAGASVRHLPSFVAALQRDVVGTDLRALQIGSLIGRPEMHIVSPEAGTIVRGKRVLVSGAGGSIGSELCRQVAGFSPSGLVMLDHDESNLHRLQLELAGEALLDTDDIVVADIRDPKRMHQIFRDFRPDVVFHAAALKHLPVLERFPCEGVKSNVMGTENLARAAVEHGVERFVLISTDKAADPTSVLGATKRLAEYVIKAQASSSTIFSAVRFGNVLGSRGSLLTVLAEQMRNGESVTITHPDVTRFFMTIEEAVGLVLEAARLAEGGETFVLDMGAPVLIVDLVSAFAASLQVPRVDIRFTGLRPGEKLNEALFSEHEQSLPTAHPKISKTGVHGLVKDFASLLHDLYDAAYANRSDDVRQYLTNLLPGYEAAGAVPLTTVGAPYPDDF